VEHLKVKPRCNIVPGGEGFNDAWWFRHVQMLLMFFWNNQNKKGGIEDDPNYFAEGLKVVKTISPTILCEQF
jgi:hypothetical protein